MTVLYPARASRRPRALRLAAVIAGLVALLLSLVALPAVGATYTLDQSILGPVVDSYQLCCSTTGLAQGITAGRTGTLTRVDIYLRQNPAFTTPQEVQIQTANAAGIPSGIVLGSWSIPAIEMREGSGVFSRSAWFNVPVVAGAQYAIVLPYSGETRSWFVAAAA